MMRIEFDCLEDFQAFAAFCGYVKHAGDRPARESVPAVAHDDVPPLSDAGGAPNEQPAETTAEKPKRTRKAKADNGASTPVNPATIGQETPASDSAASANPFAASGAGASTATQAILAAENQQQATLAGIAAMQEGVEVDTDETADEGAPDAAPMTAPQHMHLCRQFIAKHGQQKYMEAFKLAGLSASIAAYTPEQRATHAATLAALDL